MRIKIRKRLRAYLCLKAEAWGNSEIAFSQGLYVLNVRYLDSENERRKLIQECSLR